MKKSYTLGELAEKLKAELIGDAKQSITGVASLEKATSQEVAFFEGGALTPLLANTKAGLVLLQEKDKKQCKTACLVLEKPRLAFATLLTLFQDTKPSSGIHPSAIIGKNCQIDPSSWIGPYAVIGDNTVIGKNCYIHSRVTLYDGVQLGDRVIIHSGAVIGADGFGYEPNAKGEWIKVPQVGRVLMGNDVEIGANTTIDRGALDDTVIGTGVKIDNLVMIAHNVKIGDHTVIAACTGVAGSVVIGQHCVIAGAVCIGDHLTITDRVILMGAAVINKSINTPGVYSSLTGVHPRMQSHRLGLHFSKLDEMAKKIKQLEKTVGQYHDES